jgi:hypothetical protein
MKKHSTSLIIKEMQIKATLRFHLTSVRMLPLKTHSRTNVGENVGEKESPYTN